MRRARARILVSALGVCALAFALHAATDANDATAQPRGKPPKPPAGARPGAPKPAAAVDGGAPQAPGAASAATPAPSSPPTAAGASGDAGVVAMSNPDGGAQTIRFGELEIEGRLKSPQLVYFLRRVRAEFAAGDLGHRSFMRELSETRKDQAF